MGMTALQRMEIQHICDIGAELGEGPTWVPRDAALWFVDIKGRQLHRYDLASGERRAWSAPELPGFIAPVRGGGFIVGLKSGLHPTCLASAPTCLACRLSRSPSLNRAHPADLRT
jgi:sugar lactone lactonase YvrE